MKEETHGKKTAVLKATLELISEHGFHGTPMSQIAQKANIGMGTIYRYFPSKEDLINALYIDIKIRSSKFILQHYSVNIHVHEGYKQMLRDVIYYFIENQAELSFLEQYENSPLITATTREESMRVAEPIEDLFKRSIEQNLLKDLPVEILEALLSGAVISLIKLYLAGSIKLDEDSIAAPIDAIWDMIKR